MRKSVIDRALDKIDSEMHALFDARRRLLEAAEPKAKPVAPKKARPIANTSGSIE